MFRFEVSYILWFLLSLPLLSLLFYLTFRWKSNLLSDEGQYAQLRRLIPTWSVKKEWLKSSFFILALAFFIVAAANPQWGNKKQKVKAKSSDVIIALDISQSMLAEDISPNRMERAKFFLSQLIKKLKGERLGLIYFAGSAYLQMPLTNDYASAETFIKSANPSQAGTQGTVIADAIALSQTIFGIDNPTQKALIIISDGENHETEAIEQAIEAKSNGTTIFTLGIGTESGAQIPIVERGRKKFKVDKSGNLIKSALNVKNLQDIASAGGGSFYMIDQTMSAIPKLDNAIDRLEKQEVEQRSFTDFNSFFQYFILLGIIFLLASMLISNKSNKTIQQAVNLK